ncbi:MAG: hypothetical protein QOH41_774 [Blastocatellia bacterium]|jgi:hypothetical protein|nr:hypothetical protein [Blastocatellia bacterium]
MGKPHLDVYVSAEASEDEKAAVAECFDEFDVSFQKGEYRFSETALALVVSIFLGVVSATAYDLLEAAVMRLRSRASKIDRKIEVKIRRTRREYIITPDVFVARENTEETYFSSVDELFDDLKRDSTDHDKDNTAV